jgi:hypothetical protein
VRYLENPAKPYTGGAESFGPYRLLPPGVLMPERSYPNAPTSRSFADTTDRTVFGSSNLYVTTPAGYTEKSVRAKLADGQLLDVDAVWERDGKIIAVTMTKVDFASLPLDVPLYFPDSRLSIKTTSIGGRPALIEQPTAGPAPNVGYVRVWLDGRELVLTSPNLRQDELANLAATLVAGSVKP